MADDFPTVPSASAYGELYCRQNDGLYAADAAATGNGCCRWDASLRGVAEVSATVVLASAEVAWPALGHGADAHFQMHVYEFGGNPAIHFLGLDPVRHQRHVRNEQQCSA